MRRPNSDLLSSLGLGLGFGLLFVPVWVQAHGDHAKAHVEAQPDEDKQLRAEEQPQAEQQPELGLPPQEAADTGGELPDPDTVPLDLPTAPGSEPVVSALATLQSCVWRRETGWSNGGGVFARCQEAEVPVSVGVFMVDPLIPFPETQNLSQAEHDVGIVDGKVDGLALSQHAHIHGEPPTENPSKRAAYFYASEPQDKGHASHTHTTAGSPIVERHMFTLCCEAK